MITVRVWTLTTATDEIATQVFATEQEVYDSLKANFDLEKDYDTSTVEGAGAMIDELTEEQGVVLYIDEHEVQVPS